MSLNRRQLIRNAGVFGAGMAMSSLLPALARSGTFANDDYRALVCVFLAGGMDGHDTLIPFDAPSYAKWSGIREPLLGQYKTPRTREALLALKGTTSDGCQFALPPEMPGVQSLFNDNKAAVVANVGPLLEPVTASGFESGSARLPSRLFSHNDQQSTWAGGAPEGTTEGWGGLFADAMVARGYNVNPQFSAITSGGLPLMVTGQKTVPFHISDVGAGRLEALEEQYDPGALRSSIHEFFRATHFDGPQIDQGSVIRRDMARAFRSAIDTNALYNRSIDQAPALATQFPAGQLGPQLQSVARSIQIRQGLGAGRQVFLVTMGGFDTHDRQAFGLPALQAELDRGIVTFQRAMNELGVADKVTLFTASDFGRSLVVNGDGTDHGWGGHHLVVGGGVNGGQIFGTPPRSTLGHDRDAGNGRLIPDISVEQMASPMGAWFGLSEAELDQALPRRSRFPESLNLMKG